MIEFSEHNRNAQVLALHYARRLGDDYVVAVMSSQREIATSEEALRVAACFWEMTDLAVEDYDAERTVVGIDDLQFWMYRLFNHVYGYLTKAGFLDEWKQASREQYQEGSYQE
ncbi:hypothetical protein O5O45_24575 [Hahella aquimaris]|uniref:hypothetical protein n=1 Tax=Hahella sp. HNIBRBA332 TaxID=3015983 RepID=UPI00273B0AFE|nr:hypothetical protein [Hahella sp. HNIBRBA332]WLQ12906.1 hypothetical protein O5O45_24575 [Hahella sp. HNIBRBA332]